MKKRMQKGAAVFLAASLLAASALPAAAAEDVPREDSLKIAVLSDTHYLSPSLIKDTADFQEHRSGDQKMFVESAAILSALLDTVEQDDPDVLLISGDLTKDGERENHQELAQIFEQFEQESGTQVYLVPGNHDLNNSNATNFNTADGAAVPAGRTTQQDFREIYGDLVYNDDTVIATFTPAAGKQGGGLSYVARPKDGFTIIAIDSARYSADNTDSGTDEHETSGAVGTELENWIVEQVAAAKQRGDTVIGIQHHGVVPHFEMEPVLMADFLVNDYERLAQVYGDAGMAYIFTGHMHANDIASVTTESGNTLYDIETGSAVTYPSPARGVTITRTVEGRAVNETMAVKTYTGVGPITFTDPLTGEARTIDDITAYGRANNFTADSLTGILNHYLHGYYDQFLETGCKAAVEGLLGSLLGDGSQPISIEEALASALPNLIENTAPAEGPGFSVYYRDEAIRIGWNNEKIGLQLMIPVAGIADSIDCILAAAEKLMAEEATLDAIFQAAVEELAAVELARDGDNVKTLVDYVNFIYQRHLDGTDTPDLPQWAQDARALLESGALADQLIDILIHHVSGLLEVVLDQMELTDFTGITGVTYEGCGLGLKFDESRAPLIMAANKSSDGLLAVAVQLALCNMGTQIPDGYTVKDLLDNIDALLSALSIGNIHLDLETILAQLINGSDGEEGLVTAELRRQISDFGGRVADTMGVDSNYPEDNNTTITRTWMMAALPDVDPENPGGGNGGSGDPTTGGSGSDPDNTGASGGSNAGGTGAQSGTGSVDTGDIAMLAPAALLLLSGGVIALTLRRRKK